MKDYLKFIFGIPCYFRWKILLRNKFRYFVKLFPVLIFMTTTYSCAVVPYKRLNKMSDAQLSELERKELNAASQDCYRYTTNEMAIKGCEARIRHARENLRRIDQVRRN